jgi:hypothetical protein
VRGPNIGAIGHVSREIQGRVWAMRANVDGHSGGLEKRRGQPFFESRCQPDDGKGAWTSFCA